MPIFFINVILALLTSCASSTQQSPHSYKKLTESEIAQRNVEYSITAKASKDVYVEGERVYVNVKIATLVDEPRTQLTWNSDDALLFHVEAKQVSSNLGLIFPATTIRPKLPPYEVTDSTWFTKEGGWAHLTTTFLGDSRKDHTGRFGFAPGKYRAFVDLGTVSNWFHFEIREASDVESARHRVLDHKIGHYSNIFELRDVLDMMDSLLNLKETEPLRCEMLSNGIEYLCFYEYVGESMSDFSREDSLRVLATAAQYCKSCPIHSYHNVWVTSLVANLATRRGNYWRSNYSLGAYLNEIPDKVLLDHYTDWRKVYRRNERLEPHLPITP